MPSSKASLNIYFGYFLLRIALALRTVSRMKVWPRVNKSIFHEGKPLRFY